MSHRKTWLVDVAASVLLAGCAGSGAGPTPPPSQNPSPLGAAVPGAPTGLGATAAVGQISLTWSAVSASPTPTYAVKRALGASGPYTVLKSGLSQTSYMDTTVTSATMYYYEVSATNSVGESPNSALASAMTPAAGCTPGIAIPSAGGNVWPNECTTGAMDSLGTLTTVTGDIILSQQGQVYSNMRVNGTIAVTACDVTLENVEVDVGEPYTGDDSTPDLFAIWLQVPATCSTTLDHVSVITQPSPNNYVTEGVRVAYGGPVTITNSKFMGVQLGITTGPGTIKGNYAVLGLTMRGDHNEVILEDGTSELNIENNTFLNPNGQTSALSLFTEDGNNSNFMVSNNLLAGGGYTCYCGDGATDNGGNPARAVHVSFVNNVFWELYFPTVGQYGPGRAYNPAGGGQWTNNLYMNADGTLTTEQVPQPPLDGQ
jgi:hypothetical protein